MKPETLLRPTPAGLYCPAGDFYVDPVRAVDRAVVTHGATVSLILWRLPSRDAAGSVRKLPSVPPAVKANYT